MNNDMDTPVGLAEIADRIGVARNTVDQWRHGRGGGVFPKPDWTVGGRPAWRWGTILRWAVRTGRTLPPWVQEEAAVAQVDAAWVADVAAMAFNETGAFSPDRSGEIPAFADSALARELARARKALPIVLTDDDLAFLRKAIAAPHAGDNVNRPDLVSARGAHLMRLSAATSSGDDATILLDRVVFLATEERFFNPQPALSQMAAEGFPVLVVRKPEAGDKVPGFEFVDSTKQFISPEIARELIMRIAVDNARRDAALADLA